MADTRLKIAVFIDFDNIEIGVKNTLNTQFDIGVVLEALRERGDVVSKIAYSDWSRAGDYSRTLTQHATKLVQRNLTPGGDKNGADINLALDALEMAFTHPHINAYVIVGGDSDFITLVEKLKQYDKQIFVVGGRNFTSYVMQRNCHEFIAYENLIGGRRGGGERGGRQSGPVAQVAIEQVVPLVRRALKILSDREVSPQLGLLKSTLLQLDSTFSERTFGVSSFREFANKLATAGHVTVREMGRNVVVELAEGGGSAAVDEGGEAPQPSAAAAPPREPRDAREPREPREPRDRGGRHQRDEAAAAAMEPRPAEAIQEVRRLFQSAQQPPRWPMYIRQAKQFMRNVDSSFDERKFGFASIVDLLRACSREGLFKIERDRQGVMRLFQGNVMQVPVEGVEPGDQPVTPGAPRPWRPGDDIPDIHEADRPEPVAPAAASSGDVVEGDVVREVETPEVLDAQTSGETSDGEDAPRREPKKRGRTSRAKSAEPKAAKAPRAKKTSAKSPRTAKTSRARKTASAE